MVAERGVTSGVLFSENCKIVSQNEMTNVTAFL